MDEFTFGTSTVICMMGRSIRMVTERIYGRLVWFRGVPLVFVADREDGTDSEVKPE